MQLNGEEIYLYTVLQCINAIIISLETFCFKIGG